MPGDDENSRAATPQRGDRLFRGDLRDWINNACLNVMGNGDAYAYKAGYRRGAEVLIDYVCQNGRDQDFLVYPIIFLYRHHVELDAEKNYQKCSISHRCSFE